MPRYYKSVEENKEESRYESLAPISNADNAKHYTDALSWALKNRQEKDIKNNKGSVDQFHKVLLMVN